MNENIVIKIFTMKKTITTLSLIFVVTICTYAGNVSADTLTVYLQPHISPDLRLYGQFKDVPKEAAGHYASSMTDDSRLLRYSYTEKEKPLMVLLSEEDDGRFSLVADMNFNNSFADDYKYYFFYGQLSQASNPLFLQPQPLSVRYGSDKRFFHWFSPGVYADGNSDNPLQAVKVIPAFERVYYGSFEYGDKSYSIILLSNSINYSRAETTYVIIDNKDKKQSGTAFPDVPPTVEYISLNIPTAINGDMALSVGNIDFSDMTCGLTISGISGESSESIPFTGFNAPLFKKKSVEGRSISLEKMRGHYILIDFWGTWCKPCISVIPELRDIHKKYPQLELISVAVDPAPNTNYGFTPAPLKTAIKELQMDWINIQDRSAEGSEQISEKYKIKSYPTTVLIDTYGKIIYRKSSILAMDSLRQILEDVFGY